MKGTTFPTGFQPNENNRSNAQKFGVNLEAAVEAFEDYHVSKGNKFVDWNRALNTWLRNTVLFSGRSLPVDPPKIFPATPTAPPPEFIDAQRRYREKQLQGSLQWNQK